MSVDPSRQTIVAPGGTGFEGFGEAVGELLTNVIQGIGSAIAGDVTAGGGVFGAVIDGAISLIRGIGGMIASILTREEPTEPLPAVWSPIKADLENELQPFIDTVDKALEDSSAAQESIEGIKEDMATRDEQLDTLAEDVQTKGQEIADLSDQLDAKTGPESDLAVGIDNLAQETGEIYQELNTRLWGENGELWRLNSTMWDENSGWQSRMEDLTSTMQKQQADSQRADDLRDDVDKFHQTAIEANSRSIAAMQQYITRVMFLPDSATVSTAENPHWTMTFSGTKRVLTAKSGWVGDFIYHSAMNYSSGGFGPVINGGAVTPANRTFTLDVATSSGSLMYTIEPGTPQLVTLTMDNRNAAAGLALDVWKLHGVSAAVPHTLRFKVAWDAISQNQRIVTLIRVNGVTKAILDQSGIGPVWPWESGYREQEVSVTLDLAVGDQVTFCTMTNGDTTARRLIRSMTWWVEWVKPATNTTTT